MVERMINDDYAYEMITITKELYEELLEDSRFLRCLEACGVDNWDYYEEAKELLREGVQVGP